MYRGFIDNSIFLEPKVKLQGRCSQFLNDAISIQYVEKINKKRWYLAEAVHTITPS